MLLFLFFFLEGGRSLRQSGLTTKYAREHPDARLPLAVNSWGLKMKCPGYLCMIWVHLHLHLELL